MSNSPHVIDVTLENFEAEVINKSMDVPVVVDFWAPWCGPCKTLTPMMEKLAAEYGGRFILAKVNSDEQMDIAASFQVRSIPTIVALKEGRPISAFQGALPESQVRAFLDKFVPSANQERVAKAKAMLEAGDAVAARDDLRTALALDPSLDSARVLLAEIAFRDNQLDEAQKQLDAVAPRNRMEPDFERIAAKLHAASEASHLPGAAELKAKVDADANDFDARLQLATLYASQSQYESAFQLLLDVVQKDRKWNEEAARKKMLEFFTAAANEQPALVSRYRRALATALN